ncbi:MAG: M48 family metallopeptidase [Saprospiraceae bacterium]|nr:M48 family metallopeptidase [Saprospiraceae bacterium]MCC6841871.1 M48 family metallopeptidase [Saprospiraceae bacterium]
MQIEYSIQYSNRKTLSIIVERDRSVIVRAPLNTSKEVIEKEISKRKFLLFKKINHPQKYETPKSRKEFVSGESLLYLGKNHKLEVVQESIDGIQFDSKFYISQANQTNADQLFKSWYFKQAEEKIIPKAKFHAKNLGVNFKAIKILDLKYRWGSCTPKDNINFNWRLIKAPIYVIDYIIVHELTHLLESNHTPEFWNIVSVQLPHYTKAKDWLKDNGHLLEIEF